MRFPELPHSIRDILKNQRRPVCSARHNKSLELHNLRQYNRPDARREKTKTWASLGKTGVRQR